MNSHAFGNTTSGLRGSSSSHHFLPVDKELFSRGKASGRAYAMSRSSLRRASFRQKGITRKSTVFEKERRLARTSLGGGGGGVKTCMSPSFQSRRSIAHAVSQPSCVRETSSVATRIHIMILQIKRGRGRERERERERCPVHLEGAVDNTAKQSIDYFFSSIFAQKAWRSRAYSRFS
ncbi:uncharacterized protein B0I36DRAFT_153410 [Microdochium trichocladiopsis]|uniref:Uncharacterized protein n=1 Tax=Microdochium trichocladiopsis TaxID=1682393 RepID=A0A9P9BM97_9PEZI|nr:uncharacterized protein B0I36DRAFT_153410 [Microdochium trichocladiopsis]KAH7026065.1 hypothetical protein B0I36DRAFT_153410 [Microdochium trichocladiopsis]